MKGNNSDNIPPRAIDPVCLEYLATAFAQILSEGLSTDEILLLGSFITSIGQTMCHISAQTILINKCWEAAAIIDEVIE